MNGCRKIWGTSPPAIRAGLAWVWLFALAMTVLTLFHPLSHRLVVMLDDVGTAAGIGTVIPWGMMTWRVARGRRARWYAGLATLAIAAYAIGETLWTCYELTHGQEPPYPSWADAGYLAANFLLLPAVILYPGPRLPSIGRAKLLLDGLIVGVALGLFLWYFRLGPTVISPTGSLAARLVSLGYPLTDLGIIAAAVLLGLRAAGSDPVSREARRTLGWMALAMSVALVGDLFYGYMVLRGTYETGNVIDASWPLCYMLFGYVLLRDRSALAVLPERGLESEPPNEAGVPPRPLWSLLAPYVLVLAASVLVLFVLTVARLPLSRLDAGVLIGGVILILLTLARQVFTILENEGLYRRVMTANGELQNLNRTLGARTMALAEANGLLAALATTDGMTGLANHRAFQEKLQQATAYATCYGEPLILLLLDVDRFKDYNDTFGHPAGDEVLKQLAQVLRDTIRLGDSACRYGGEEFAVILLRASRGEAFQAAERLRAAVAAHPFAHRGVTVSVGMAEWDTARHPDIRTLITEADQALYLAKQRGRNQVAWADAPRLFSDSRAA